MGKDSVRALRETALSASPTAPEVAALPGDDQPREHALPFRRCTARDVFSVKDGGEQDANTQAIIAASDAYLSAFVAPVRNADDKAACFHCGSVVDGLMHALGVGAAYQWGMCHGEAQCSKCGWPARGMHYPKDEAGEELWTARNMFLAYHPDYVEQAA